jgi:hypothetical protein
LVAVLVAHLVLVAMALVEMVVLVVVPLVLALAVMVLLDKEPQAQVVDTTLAVEVAVEPLTLEVVTMVEMALHFMELFMQAEAVEVSVTLTAIVLAVLVAEVAVLVK